MFDRTQLPTPRLLWLLAICALPVFTLAAVDSPATGSAALTDSEGVLGDCTATLDPGEVHPGEDPVSVVATLSESVGQIDGVVVDEESGVGVLGYEMNSDTEVGVTLGTANANDGEWTVTVLGEAGLCVGSLTVSTPDDPSARR